MNGSRRPVVAGLAAALLLGLPGTGVAQAAGDGSPLYAPAAEPFGRSYQRVFGHYAKWILQIPSRRNPSVDPDSPNNCAVHSDFVFMGSRGTGQGCTVPTGKAVAFSFGFWECSTAEGNGDTFARLRRCARANYIRTFNKYVFRFVLRVDGRKVAEPRRWTLGAANRVADLPRNNLFGAQAGPTKTASYGLFHIFKPFSRGEHLIRVRGEDWELGKFTIAYRFTVE